MGKSANSTQLQAMAREDLLGQRSLRFLWQPGWHRQPLRQHCGAELMASLGCPRHIHALLR